LVSMLGFDILFQDVDIVWYKNPLEYFHNASVQQYDMIFQDDGGHSIRFAPYSANSGFYYVKNTKSTRYFLTSLLMAGDLVSYWGSHQQVMIALLGEHVSMYSLKVKVLNRDTGDVPFPAGYHFHKLKHEYMMPLLRGTKVHPYIFHMSWTLNKEHKVLFFRQMGNWFLQDKCIGKKVSELGTSGTSNFKSLTTMCCAAEPLVSCHFRDKPSIIPCKKSPLMDKGGKSFW
jgi:hypothetical protein